MSHRENLKSLQDILSMGSKWKDAKCPYCFELFSPFSACFRSHTKKTQQDLDNLSKDTPDNEKKMMERYRVAVDPKLVEYSGDEELYAPLLCSFVNEADKNRIIQRFDYELDDNGFPIGMYDDYGALTKERVCPHCHNTLPEQFGKYPIAFVGITGVMKSGKTVYISQFLSNLNKFLPQFGLSVIGDTSDVDKFISSHPIKRKADVVVNDSLTRNEDDDKEFIEAAKKDFRLPKGTTKKLKPKPISLIVQNNDTRKINTIVFYDIAGENCVDVSLMTDYGPFIKNANCLMLIVDPAQFADVFELDISDKKEIRPEKVIQTMYSSFLSDDNSNKRCDTPLAVAFSKNDLLQNYFEANREIINDVRYDIFGCNRHGMALQSFERSSEVVQKTLYQHKSRAGENFVNILRNQFSDVGFFTFSALNTAPIEVNGLYYLNTDPSPVRIEEPIGWLFYRMGICSGLRVTKETKKKLFGKSEEIRVVKSQYNDRVAVKFWGGERTD